MSPRCDALVGKRTYSLPGRCLIERNVKPLDVLEGSRRLRVAFCAAHRKLAAEKRRVPIAGPTAG